MVKLIGCSYYLLCFCFCLCFRLAVSGCIKLPKKKIRDNSVHEDSFFFSFFFRWLFGGFANLCGKLLRNHPKTFFFSHFLFTLNQFLKRYFLRSDIGIKEKLYTLLRYQKYHKQSIEHFITANVSGTPPKSSANPKNCRATP